MKRYIYPALLVSATVITAACGNNEEAENIELTNNNHNENIPEEHQEENENQAEIDTEENNNVNEDTASNAENNSDHGEDNSAENNDLEEAYEIAEDSSLQPVDDADEEVVLMTIDDAPDDNGVEMAEILAENDVPAIFFVNGHFLQSDEGREELKAIHELGFEIGNHTMNHLDLAADDVTEEEQYDEIVDLNDLVEEIIGERPRFFRAPLGHNTEYSKELLEEKNMQWMNWTYGYDWEPDYMEPEPLEEIMVETELLKNGANLLMHDREHSKEALEGIIAGLRDQGYEFLDPDKIENND
ncbi:polysaccharide deacetylase family protein [Salisediminibacterium halotolerans]|uniref:polysaccharide deacetylase family protein n=1 Tax=Salisediminibacterium halotolerans TaxID=517425 RepID=UPI000EB13A00|nr:polysaccharide deacetylase family protein [Salisediminibacterium halotolerans]RLJ74353.1 peptidoglycan/xylan/chitin deacetylase (PgdA/CDA1 family) [Actinophytocola xinjiangensis]RPE87554.1 peptidoglycan/xylan/chitin deacetylase (PgdA/CDA1 family) [Salisediminibacterium halotolerans]TWG35190.1 peptidoglycan/xylan/chitin deacetylase (PgdA/CDA1 family) [Salisediminibacterium halotolerans]GEL08872.1 hypothetical protein SHA02_22880 [Salisediminibacterium halotolerans]